VKKNKTIIEKIFEKHTMDDVEPGKVIWLDIDYRAARDFGGPNVVKHLEEHFKRNRIDDTEKTFFTFDTSAPAKTIAYANNQQRCRLFARNEGIKVFDVDMGIGSHIAIEQGLIYSGVTSVSTDSHMNIVGGIGAFGQGMGDIDIAFIFRTGKTWFEVPRTMKINLVGDFNYPVTAKDITLKVVKTIGQKGALGRVIEYYGDAVDKLRLFERLTLASMATEMGAIISFVPPNDEILKIMSDNRGKYIDGVFADKNAEYSEEITIDLKNLEPQIALPPSPDNVKNVKDIIGLKVDSVFVGSCTNGRYEDIKLVADYLSGKKVDQDVMLRIVPATKQVYQKLLFDGTLKKLYDSGAIISNPGCAGCAQGQIGMTGKNEVQLSTANRNFPGKQGEGDTYLVSPLIAAASALKGKIALP